MGTLDDEILLTVLSCTYRADYERGTGPTLRMVVLPLAPIAGCGGTTCNTRHTPGIKKGQFISNPKSNYWNYKLRLFQEREFKIGSKMLW